MKHGLSSYITGACRCDVCRAANTEAQRVRRRAIKRLIERHADEFHELLHEERYGKKPAAPRPGDYKSLFKN